MSLRRMVRRSLLALGLGAALAMSAAGLESQAKASDAVGQDPTAPYDDGRGANLQADAGPSYIPGIGFEIGAIMKFHQRK